MRYRVDVKNETSDARMKVFVTESCPQTAQEAALLLLFRDFGWRKSTASVPVEEKW